MKIIAKRSIFDSKDLLNRGNILTGKYLCYGTHGILIQAARRKDIYQYISTIKAVLNILGFAWEPVDFTNPWPSHRGKFEK